MPVRRKGGRSAVPRRRKGREKEPVPSAGTLRECPEVVVRRKPAGSVSEAPGIMLIPCTSRGGNCRRHDGPRLKFLSSLCQHTRAFEKAKGSSRVVVLLRAIATIAQMCSTTTTLLCCTASSHTVIAVRRVCKCKSFKNIKCWRGKLLRNLWFDRVKGFSIG